MIETYKIIITLLPIIIYSAIGTILFYRKKITFNNQLALVLVTWLIYIGISLFYRDYAALIQILIALLAFVVMIIFLSGRVSGETILSMSSLFALTPLPHGVFGFLGVFVVLIISSIIIMKNEQGTWTKTYAEFRDTILLAFLSTGLAHSLPNYEYMEERSKLPKDAKKISILPYILISFTLLAVYFLFRTLTLES